MAIFSQLLLLSLAFAGKDDDEISEIQKPKEGKDNDYEYKVRCKVEGKSVELTTGSKMAWTRSKLGGSSDGFTARVTQQTKEFKDNDGESKCAARYRFFRIWEKCADGQRYDEKGNYGKIEEWSLKGSKDCTKNPSQWLGTSSIRGMSAGKIEIAVYYCSTPLCQVNNSNGGLVTLTPDAIKFDLTITGLESKCNSSNSTFGIDVRASTKSEIKTGKRESYSDKDETGAPCNVSFSWASGAIVNGLLTAIKPEGCWKCGGNDKEESDRNEKEYEKEVKTCCSFQLADGPKTIFWDPEVATQPLVAGSSSLFVSFASFLVVAYAVLF